MRSLSVNGFIQGLYYGSQPNFKLHVTYTLCFQWEWLASNLVIFAPQKLFSQDMKISQKSHENNHEPQKYV